MKVEDMIVGNKKPNYKCLDTLGNELREGDLVTVVFMRPPMFRVVATQPGGLSTPNGVAPQMIRVVCDMNIMAGPGQRLQAVAKVVNPMSEALLDEMSKAQGEPPTRPQ